MQLIDTHCHVHEIGVTFHQAGSVHTIWDAAGIDDAEGVIAEADAAGVKRLVCVGTSLHDSERAVAFVAEHERAWATVGIHPHDAHEYAGKTELLSRFAELAKQPKVVAIGEGGLDYFYNRSPKKEQIEIFKFQIEVALQNNLPMTFHVREAFNDFWPIFEDYHSKVRPIRGVLHSFTDSKENMERAIAHGLYIGVNGIATFTKKPEQTVMFQSIPLNRLLLETDAPFLTPAPYRGTICEPKHVRATAEFLSSLRSEHLDQLASATTENAVHLFGLN